MQENDFMEVIGVIGKLNRTIDSQQDVINEYAKRYGPLTPPDQTTEENKKEGGAKKEHEKGLDVKDQHL